MAILAKGQKDREWMPTPSGAHPAVCADVVDLGEQESGFLDEKTGKPKVQHKIRIAWQVLIEADDQLVADLEGRGYEQGEDFVVVDAGHGPEIQQPTKEGNRRFLVSQWYTLSLHEKANLRKDLDAWRGKSFTDEDLKEGFDVEKLVGAPCLLNVTQSKSEKNGKVYANVSSIMPLPRGMSKIAPEGYVRVKDRDDAPEKEAPAAAKQDEDYDLPF